MPGRPMINHNVIRFWIVWIPTTIVGTAFVLAVRLYVEPRLYWRDLWVYLFFLAFQATLVWLIGWAPWSARVFAMGVVLGAIVEHRALGYYVDHDLLRLTPGTWTPEGWYPLMVPVERLFIQKGWATIAEPPLMPLVIGMALSSALCGGLLSISSVWWWKVWARRTLSWHDRSCSASASD